MIFRCLKIILDKILEIGVETQYQAIFHYFPTYFVKNYTILIGHSYREHATYVPTPK